MSKSEQIGGGGGTETTPRTERKLSGKRPWRKPKLRLVEFAVTEANLNQPASTVRVEGPGQVLYDPNVS